MPESHVREEQMACPVCPPSAKRQGCAKSRGDAATRYARRDIPEKAAVPAPCGDLSSGAAICKPEESTRYRSSSSAALPTSRDEGSSQLHTSFSPGTRSDSPEALIFRSHPTSMASTVLPQLRPLTYRFT